MAAFTSVQTGDWDDGATWGNDSPGVKGTDWPGSAGDTFTVDTGHEVTYNVSETNELGASTINGTLTFVTDDDTKLTFGNVSLTIGAAGTLNVGSAVTPVGAAYTAEIIFNTTGDNAQGITVTDGGTYNIYGDSAYCTSWETTLDNNAENTDGDNTIITNNDMDGDWHVGDEITIKRESTGDSSSRTDAVVVRTIAGISGTTITLNDTLTGVTADVGDTWVSRVANVTRNVKIYKYGAETDIQSASRYNTNRPFFVDNTTGVNSNVCSHVQFTGLYRITINGGTFTNCIVRNGENGFNSSDNNTVSGDVYSNYYGVISSNNNTVSGDVYSSYYGFNSSNNNTVSGDIYSSYYGFNSSDNNTVSGDVYSNYRGFISFNNNTVSGDIYSNYRGVISSNNNTVSGDIYSNTYGFESSNNNTVSGDIYSNTYGFYSSNNNTVSGRLGYNGAVSAPNTNDLGYSPVTKCKNCKMPLAGLSLYDLNDIDGASLCLSDHDDKTLNSHKTYQVMGNTIKTACDGTGDSPSVDPDTGNGYCIEVSNLQSNLSASNFIKVLNDYEYGVYAEASVEKTYTFKIQSTFTDTLANTEIILEGKYMAGADGALTTTASTETIATRSNDTDWTQSLSVTFTPSQTGFAFFQIKLCKYESGKEIYVWPEAVIS